MNVLEFQRDSVYFHQRTSIEDTKKLEGSYIYSIVLFATSTRRRAV